MARTAKSDNILDQIKQDLAAAETEVAGGEAPAFVEIGGVRYYKEQAQAAAPRAVRKLWRNPRKPNDAPVEMEVEQVAINVAPYADRITLDGVIYLAGRVYEFPTHIAQTVREICYRTWQHEASTGGAYTNGTQSVRGSAGQVGVMAPGIAFG